MTVAAGPRLRTRLEWALALAAAAAWVAVMCWAGRNLWFRWDVFDFLTRGDLGLVESWTTPHAGHFQLAAVLLHQLLYAIVGLDFWPWYYLPTLLAYAGLSLLLWRVLLRRGVPRGTAFGAYLLVMSLGVSAFLSTIAVGGMIVLALLLLVAERLDADLPPSLPVKVLVALSLLVMVSSSSLGVAGVGACLLTVVLTGRLRRWWWTFLPGLIAYGAWYLTLGGNDDQGSVDWGHLLSAPADALRMVGSTATRLFGFRGGGLLLGVAVAGALAAWFAWLAWKRRLGRWDLVFGAALAAYLLMVAMVRGSAGIIPIDTARYSWPVMLLLIPLIVPHVRLPERWPVAVRAGLLVLVGGSLVVMNTLDRIDQTNAIERIAATGRVAIETVGRALADGEPALDGVSLKRDLGIATAGVLTVGDMRGFLADGWNPTPQGRWPEWRAARPGLRLKQGAGEVPAGTAAPLVLAGGEVAEGCADVAAWDELSFTVVNTGEFRMRRVSRDFSAPVTLVWRDSFGSFRVEIMVSPKTTMAAASPPVGGAELTIINRAQKLLTVCGVVGG